MRSQADPRLGGAPHATIVRGEEMATAGLDGGHIATLWQAMPAGTFAWRITGFEIFTLGKFLQPSLLF